MEIVPGFNSAQARYDREEPEDDGDCLCVCGHESSFHNNGDRCSFEDCECKSLSYPEREWERDYED